MEYRRCYAFRGRWVITIRFVAIVRAAAVGVSVLAVSITLIYVCRAPTPPPGGANDSARWGFGGLAPLQDLPKPASRWCLIAKTIAVSVATPYWYKAT